MAATGGLVRRKSIVGSNSQIPNITTLLKKFADGCYYLNSYNCLEAIEEFKKLPQQHFNTGWVLSNVGKAYMEIVRYQDAANFYEQAFRNEPHRT